MKKRKKEKLSKSVEELWEKNVLVFAKKIFYPIYQPLRSGRIWHKVNF